MSAEGVDPYRSLASAIVLRALMDASGLCQIKPPDDPAEIRAEARAFLDDGAGPLLAWLDIEPERLHALDLRTLPRLRWPARYRARRR